MGTHFAEPQQAIDNIFAAMASLQADQAELHEELANLKNQAAQAVLDNLSDDLRLDALEAWRETVGQGGGTDPDPDPGTPPGPVGRDKMPNGVQPPDGVARNHDHLMYLAKNAQAGATIKIAGKFKTAAVLIGAKGVTVEGISPPNPDGTPTDELQWDAAKVWDDGWDKGILIFNLHPDLRTVPPPADANLKVRNLVLRGAKAKDANGAGIRIDSNGSGTSTKPMWNNVLIENVWTIDCQNGGLGTWAGDGWLVKYRTEGWGQGGMTHGFYATGQNTTHNTGRLFVRGYWSRRGSEGHPLKSRMRYNDIRDYDVVSTSNESYELDVCQGGILYLENALIVQGKRSPNKAVIGYGEERSKGTYPVNRIIFGPNCTLQTDVGLIRNRWFNTGSGQAGKPWAGVEVYGWPSVIKIWNPPSLKSKDADPFAAFTLGIEAAPPLDTPTQPH